MVPAHRTVLLEPAIEALLKPGLGDRHAAAPRRDGVYVDGTFGRGGHGRRLLQALAAEARLLVFDKDPQAVAAARQLQAQDARVEVVHDTFAALATHLDAQGIAAVDGLLLDLGVSSPQLDEA